MNLILKFWRFATEHGRKPQAVFAIIAANGNILGWSVNKRAARKELEKYSDVHDDLLMARIEPI